MNLKSTLVVLAILGATIASAYAIIIYGTSHGVPPMVP